MQCNAYVVLTLFEDFVFHRRQCMALSLMRSVELNYTIIASVSRESYRFTKFELRLGEKLVSVLIHSGVNSG